MTAPHIDASLRDFQLIVGSTDISSLVDSGSLSREQPDQETPAYWRGQITIAGGVIGSSLDLDPRTNPLWLRYANTVILRIADSGGTLRDVARLLISLASYDDWPTAKFLELELVDNLGRESFSRALDFGSYSAASILTGLGIPVGGSVPTRLSPIDSGFDNPIGLAQSLAWSSGLLDGGDPYILYTDSAGTVQARRKSTTTTFRRGDREILGFSQFPPSEEIASQVVTSATWRYLEEVPTADINTNDIVEIVQVLGSIISRQTTKFNNDGTLESEKTEIRASEIYPEGDNILATSLEISYSYNWSSDGRLLGKTTTTRVPTYQILETTGSPLFLRIQSEVTEQYSYSDTKVSSIITTQSARELILPGSEDPFTRSRSQVVETTWRKSGGAWNQSIRVQRARGLVDATLESPFLLNTPSNQSISPSNPPPAPTLRPQPLSAQRTVVEETVQGSCEVAVLGQIPATRIVSVTLTLGIGDNELLLPVDEVRELVRGSLDRGACYIADEIAGRAYARRIEMPIPDEWILNPLPLIRADIRDERHHLYGETVTWGNGTTRFEAIGVLVGKIATVANPPEPVLPAIVPAETETGFELTITDLASLSYSVGIPITPLVWQGFGGDPPYTFDISSGSLPTGLSLSSSGILTGTPTTEGSYPFTVRVTDDEADTATDTITITVGAVAATIPVFGDVPRLSALIGYMPEMGDPGFTLLMDPMSVLFGYMPVMDIPVISTALRVLFGYMPVLGLPEDPGGPVLIRYEAEDATMPSGTIESRSNASNLETVSGVTNADPLEFAVEFSRAGEYQIDIRYSSTFGSGWDLNVVGIKNFTGVEAVGLFNTGGTNTFLVRGRFAFDVSIAQTGSQVILFLPSTVGDEGVAEIDCIDVYFVASFYEAEDATINSGAIQSRSNASNLETVRDITSTDPIEFTVDFPEEGDYDIEIGYSATGDCDWDVEVVGITTGVFSIFDTEDFNTFTSDVFYLPIGVGESGSQTVRLSPATVGDEGLAEIDYIKIVRLFP